MNRSYETLLAFGFVMATYLPVTVLAASITGDSFQVGWECCSGNLNLPLTSGTAGGPGSDVQVPDFEFDWIDENSFEFTYFFNSISTNNLVLSIVGLDFVDGTTLAAISGVTLDPSVDPEQYAAYDPSFGPNISFTANSIEIGFFSYPDGLHGDQVPWQFNVTAGENSGVSPIPLPSTFWLLFSAGALLIGRRRGSF